MSNAVRKTVRIIDWTFWNGLAFVLSYTAVMFASFALADVVRSLGGAA